MAVGNENTRSPERPGFVFILRTQLRDGRSSSDPKIPDDPPSDRRSTAKGEPPDDSFALKTRLLSPEDDVFATPRARKREGVRGGKRNHLRPADSIAWRPSTADSVFGDLQAPLSSEQSEEIVFTLCPRRGPLMVGVCENYNPLLFDLIGEPFHNDSPMTAEPALLRPSMRIRGDIAKNRIDSRQESFSDIYIALRVPNCGLS